jgi:bacterioferritin-associated ferredoxin
MIVCICHRVSDRTIESEVRRGCHSFEALQDELCVGNACGACEPSARQTFDDASARHAQHLGCTQRASAARSIPIHVLTQRSSAQSPPSRATA